MFHSKESEVTTIHTLIGSDCIITGDLSSTGHLQIDGTIKGNVLCKDMVTIGQTGVVNGNVSCSNGYIEGIVKGNVTSDNILTIETGGKIIGDIQVKRIIINENGVLDGKCTMIIDEHAHYLSEEDS